jgi:hypothetical protein
MLMATVDPYVQVETMRRWSDTEGTDPYDGERSGPVKSAHSYSACRNRISESGALYRRILVSGASSRASAFSFIARSAST